MLKLLHILSNVSGSLLSRRKCMLVWLSLGLSLGGMLATAVSVWAEEAGTPAQTSPFSLVTPTHKERGMLDTITESLFGDVYAEPSRWQKLSLGSFFSEGWDEPWVSPPTGGGGAPRQGWLNASDGVFYRLAIATFGWSHNFLGNGEGYTGLLQIYTPFNRRFEFRTDIPVVSNRGLTGDNTVTKFGDFQITPRFILSETRNVTQSFNVTFRTPTGDTSNVNGVAAVTPAYEFWFNSWKGLVLRGGTSLFVPYNAQGLHDVGARTAFIGNLAVGYYFTPHDLTPIGDMVWYLATNVVQTVDDRSSNKNTFITLTPGFRTHLGRNWYLLGAVEVPVTDPQPFDYQVLTGLMKVF